LASCAVSRRPALLDCGSSSTPRRNLAITGALAAGDEVSFTGFGKFHVAERGPRQGVNPRTGERITIPGGKVPRFSAGSALKTKVKG
jgi:nucleoid DNA-binding protein